MVKVSAARLGRAFAFFSQLFTLKHFPEAQRQWHPCSDPRVAPCNDAQRGLREAERLHQASPSLLLLEGSIDFDYSDEDNMDNIDIGEVSDEL